MENNETLAAGQAVETKRKIPVVSLILVGLATIIQFCLNGLTVTGALEVAALVAICLGLILGKKERNLIVAFGFVGLAVALLVGAFWVMGNNLKMGALVSAILPNLVVNLLKAMGAAMIGISYLVAKPKIAGLKIAGCILVMAMVAIQTLGVLITLIALKGNPMVHPLLDLSSALLPYVGAILYTPYKK